jgi:hypothetical protein
VTLGGALAGCGPDARLWITTSNRDGSGDPKPGDDKIIAVTV